MGNARQARRKLCVVNPFQQGGGAEYQIRCLLDELAKDERFEVFYLARYVDDSVIAPPYEVVRIGTGAPLSALGHLDDARPLYQALKRIGPDVIYQRVACAYTGICAHYARRTGTRMIWHVAHDSDVSRDSSIFGRHPARRFFEKRSVEYGIRHATHIVVQTSDQASALRRNYGRRADVVIPNFQPAPRETIDKSGPLTVTWVANVKPIKRPDAFVRMAAALRDLPAVRFILIGAAPGGSGDAAWYASLRESMAALPNLEYAGQLPQEEVNAVLARSHVFVNTSIQEGFPNTFIQAWMREVPVVSLAVNPDNVLETQGVGVFAGNEQRMAEGVRMLLTDEASRKLYAARARAYAMKTHSTSNAAVLEKLLATGQVGLSG